ncbi:MAG: c-type cytochrome biogenesis protein CcmI [Alphaproteobacteria bacterium]|nr:c-type cytochrome biogenesis protein CcmI [Alphaproteobacteria bacterium]
MLWLAIVVLSAVVILLVWRAVFAAEATAAERADYGINVYKDQLAEIGRDRAGGLLSEEQAAAARIEVERRMLAASVDRAPAGRKINPKGARISAASVAVALPALAFIFYLGVGSPDKPDQPLAGRDLSTGAMAESAQIRAMVEGLRDRLAANPNDLQGWMMLGRSYAVLGRRADSAEAYRRAVEQSQGDPEVLSAYAEALVYAADGVVTPPARAGFEEVLRAQPDDARARYYVGLAMVQAGDAEGGLARWRALEADSPPDAPWLQGLRSRMAEVAKSSGADLARPSPAPRLPSMAQAPVTQAPAAQGAGSGTPRGPSQADIEAAGRMSPQDRQAMIRSMVEGLEARLADNPNDLEGWRRLARSWGVLGEHEKARAAQASADALASGAASVAPAPSGTRPGATPTPRGPTQSDIEAAGRMAPQDRTAMIRGMVEGLEARLADNPNDLEGWRRLARSWGVLGERAKAQAAHAQAAALAPDRVDVQLDYARSLYPEDGDPAKVPPAFVATMRRIHAIDPDHAEALYHVGFAEAAAGNKAGARELWTRLLAKTQPGSPGYAEIKRRIDSLNN